MVNEIARRDQEVRLAPDMPTFPMSEALERAYYATSKPHPDIGPPKVYPAILQEEAMRALMLLRGFADPVPENIARLWLSPIPNVVRDYRDSVGDWFAGVTLALRGMECGAFTETTQRAALRNFKFFPSAADIYDILSDPAWEIRHRVRVLNTIVKAPTSDASIK